VSGNVLEANRTLTVTNKAFAGHTLEWHRHIVKKDELGTPDRLRKEVVKRAAA